MNKLGTAVGLHCTRRKPTLSYGAHYCRYLNMRIVAVSSLLRCGPLMLPRYKLFLELSSTLWKRGLLCLTGAVQRHAKTHCRKAKLTSVVGIEPASLALRSRRLSDCTFATRLKQFGFWALTFTQVAWKEASRFNRPSPKKGLGPL